MCWQPVWKYCILTLWTLESWLWLKAFLSIVDALQQKDKSKCYRGFVRQERTVTITDADSAACREHRQWSPGSQDYSSIPWNVQLVLGYGAHGTCQLSSGHSTAAGLRGNLCNEMFPFHAKTIWKSSFGTCVDISNRGSRMNPSLLCLCIVVCQHRSALRTSGIRGSRWISGPSLILVFCLGTFQEGGYFGFLSDW